MLDPTDLPGLAHFCEHMLFLGTEKVSGMSTVCTVSNVITPVIASTY
jgi:predicted Zn-dependent peptidase